MRPDMNCGTRLTSQSNGINAASKAVFRAFWEKIFHLCEQPSWRCCDRSHAIPCIVVSLCLRQTGDPLTSSLSRPPRSTDQHAKPAYLRSYDLNHFSNCANSFVLLFSSSLGCNRCASAMGPADNGRPMTTTAPDPQLSTLMLVERANGHCGAVVWMVQLHTGRTRVQWSPLAMVPRLASRTMMTLSLWHDAGLRCLL